MRVISNLKSNRIIKKIRVAKWKKYALRDMLPASKIKYIKKHPDCAERIISEYLNKKTELKQKLDEEIDHALQNSVLARRKEIDMQKIKRDVLLYWLVYGYSVNEYLCYGFFDKTFKERREYVSDRESVLLGYHLNDIDAMMIFSDKIATYRKFRKYYQREAVSISNQSDYGVFEKFIGKYPEFVKKNVLESCGRSVERISLAEEKKTTKELFEGFLSEGKIILEEVVKQHPSIASFNESSVNTFRCITLRENDKISVLYCFMKVGRKGCFIDNGAAGGILVGIDCSSGELGTDGVDEFGCRFPQHPDSGIVFKGFKIPEWENMLNMCKEMALQIPKVRLIGWDTAYTDKGWVLIEGNSMTEVIGPQSTWMRGIRGRIR